MRTDCIAARRKSYFEYIKSYFEYITACVGALRNQGLVKRSSNRLRSKAIGGSLFFSFYVVEEWWWMEKSYFEYIKSYFEYIKIFGEFGG